MRSTIALDGNSSLVLADKKTVITLEQQGAVVPAPRLPEKTARKNCQKKT